jgi:hypothetical protein
MLKSYSLDWEPPATTIVSPVIYEESSLHKNAATPAHSSDCPIRFKEFDSLIVFKASSFSQRARLKLRLLVFLSPKNNYTPKICLNNTWCNTINSNTHWSTFSR